MAVLDYYGLAFDPFEKNSLLGRQSFISRDHRKATEAMQAASTKNGFAVITAKSGLGKSHATDRFLESLDASAYTPAYVVPGMATITELYRMLCIQFKLDPSGNKQRLLHSVKHFLYNCFMRKKPAVIVIDEAQDLKVDTLAELRILRNFDRDSTDVFTLILTGEPLLASMIQNKERLDSLKQRVTSHYNFTGLTNEEISAYITHKLAFAGGSDILIDEKAVNLLCESSQGISRTIDHIMSDALRWGIQMSRVDGGIAPSAPHRNPDVRLSRIRLFTRLIN